jgi:hypothetical protein
MSERVLYDEGLRVSLEKVAGRVLLKVTNGTPTAFLCDPEILEDALHGAPLQLSSSEGYCQIEKRSDQIHLSFGLQGHSREACSVTLSDFADALAWAKPPTDES